MTALPPADADPSVPLVVDLDGTLLRSDLLHESTLRLIGQAPWALLQLPLWLGGGKANLKRQIAARVAVDVATLPYDTQLVDWIAAERARGRQVVLCSASDETLVRQVAEHLGIFDVALGSDGVTNLSAGRKAEALVGRFGAQGFDYAGNAHADVPVWAQARKAILVAPHRGVRDAALRVAEVHGEFGRPGASIQGWLGALRLHQWLKNLLVFLPLLASHRIGEWPLLVDGFIAFFAFGLSASSVYVLNDLIDLEHDRAHPRKKNRPFAAGRLSPVHGLAAAVGCLVAGLAVGSMAGAAFVAWLLAYLVLTLLYTFVLKRKVLVDALTLAALYTVRVLAGGAAEGIWPGFWLLALSLFIFLSLAFVKRYSELDLVLRQGRSQAGGRDYRTSDLPLIQTIGIVSGFCAVVVMALYINGESISRLYPHENFVWLTVPILLYWINRMWVKAHRGEMHDDPVVFAVSDGLSLLIIAAFAAVMVAAAVPW